MGLADIGSVLTLLMGYHPDIHTLDNVIRTTYAAGIARSQLRGGHMGIIPPRP
jgi:hypothetical protein